MRLASFVAAALLAFVSACGPASAPPDAAARVPRIEAGAPPDDGAAPSSAPSIVGCWEGAHGDELVELQFDDAVVRHLDLRRDAVYEGLYVLDEDRLTLQFGEPERAVTYTVTLDEDELVFVEVGFTHARAACSAIE